MQFLKFHISALLFLIITSNKADSQSFYKTINPTGNPVGGGIGYSKIISSKKADFVVHDAQGLIKALAEAKKGQVVYVSDDAVINLTPFKNVLIHEGVTLASGRGRDSEGALIYSESIYPKDSNTAVFITGGEKVRITGIRMKGPNPEILDEDYSYGVANAIRCLHKYFEMDNCEIWAWDKWALWLDMPDDAYIHHNYFHHTMRQGFGYPVWIGGSSHTEGDSAVIEANLFEAARHCIASGAQPNSWIGRYNVILERQLWDNINRHNSGKNNQGGKNTILKNNLFFSTNRYFYIRSPRDSAGVVEISNNYFMKDSASSGITDISNPKISVHDNHYNGEGRTLPVAVILADKDSGTAPLKVYFASQSFDSNGSKIAWCQWRFGDGDFSENEIRSEVCDYTFKEPGVYTVSLIAYNEYGIPSQRTLKQITVLPKKDKYVLSCWIKDNYIQHQQGIAEKEILLDNKVVWRDDIEGNEGWQHVVVSLDTAQGMIAGSKHIITARAMILDSIPKKLFELDFFIDDFCLLNSSSLNPGFEYCSKDKCWDLKYSSDSTGMTSEYATADYRSGEHSIRFIARTNAHKDVFGEVSQEVILK